MIAGLVAVGATAASAQDMPALVTPGDAVVTGFSGATKAEQVDKRYIDLNGPSMQVLAGGPGPISVSDTEGGNPAAKFQIAAGQVGQVFGIALDDNTVGGQKAPNIYLTATSLFGIQIVGPDADGDGQPDRITNGSAEAYFMEGQFGLLEGAGPGTIYKVDGTTGEVTVFANITLDGKANSGPGLGNIAFDAVRRQLLVADMDTGMIHRVDMNGQLVGQFDHGVTGRPAASLAPVPHNDTARMDITSPSFSAEDTTTWGLAAPERRVIGVAVRDNRLFYSVNGTTKQIWSVGLNEDGSFGDDVRLEIDAVGSEGAPMITDITFDSQGRIYLAQRGQQTSSFDYSVFAPSGDAKVLRYAQSETGEGWTPDPQDYAIGMRPDHLEASGGVAIGNGPGSQSCRMLWSTGDNLQPKSVIHGIQGNGIKLVRPQNVPPVKATYVDYDGHVNDPATAGHVGDVEVLRQCDSAPPLQPIPAVLPVPEPVGGDYLVPIHWKSGSYGGHWKCASYRHHKRWSHRKWHSRHHRKFASRHHWKRRSHRKLASRGHHKRRSHWKCFSHHHSKYRSHFKFASYAHSKRRSHWKHASRHHSKRRSHWKHASRHHTKLRSHYKHASRHHSKRRSHWKKASRSHHRKIRSHHKHGSRRHYRRRSHFRHASRGHHRRRISRLRNHHRSRISRLRRPNKRIKRFTPRRNRIHRTRRVHRIRRIHRPMMRSTPRFRPRGFRRR